MNYVRGGMRPISEENRAPADLLAAIAPTLTSG
jgi:hypothetical protein